MEDVIRTGDLVTLSDGTQWTVKGIELFVGLYVLDWDGVTVIARRHEFQPVKWQRDVIGNTGIGVCAANGSGQQGAF